MSHAVYIDSEASKQVNECLHGEVGPKALNAFWEGD